MTRILRIINDNYIEIALVAGILLLIWLFLRPAPRVGMLSNLRGYICTPSIERLRSQARLRGCGPGPVYPPECERRYPFSSEMPLDLPGPPRLDDPADWWKGGEEK